MHIYFSGIGGAGIGPLALIAKQAGYDVSGSDLKDSRYIDYLRGFGITDIHIGQETGQIAATHSKKPIDWLVFSSALPKTNPNHPELVFCLQHHIKTSKRDELINKIITDKNLKLIAIAGTHGKTTTTAMAIWLLNHLGVPISYSVGAKLSFGDMGHFDPASEYFVYEADEYDYNFLHFKPYLSMITGIDWDHPDIYPTRDSYYHAFRVFLDQSRWNALWRSDAEKFGTVSSPNTMVLDDNDEQIAKIPLVGAVNRQNAYLVAMAAKEITYRPFEEMIKYLKDFPGLSRRFEPIVPNLYTDYAHTPPKIEGALQMAHEVAGNDVVVVYEGLHNTRQHFIKEQLTHLFDQVKQLYIVPSYLAREDESLKQLSPDDLKDLLSDQSKAHTEAAQMDDEFKKTIKKHLDDQDLVLCLSAGGSGSLDEWLRKEFGQ